MGSVAPPVEPDEPDTPSNDGRVYTIGEKLLFSNMEEVAPTYLNGTYWAGTVGGEMAATDRSGYSSYKNIKIRAGETYELGTETRLVQFYDDNNIILNAYNYKNTVSSGTTIKDVPMDVDCWMSTTIENGSVSKANYITRLT